MATSQQSSSATTRTKFSFDDAPAPPTITLTLGQLKDKSLWDRVKEAAKSLSPESFMAKIQDERQKIEAKLDEGTELTDEDIEFLNQSAEEQVNEAFNTFKKQYLEHVKIQKTDSPEEIKLKIEVQRGLTAWLKDLFAWVIKKLKEIFAMIKKAVKWCFEQVKELFKKLFSFITS